MRALAEAMRQSRHPARLFVGVVLWRTGLADHIRLAARHPDGFRVRLSPTTLGANFWADPRGCNADQIEFLRAMLRPGEVAVDAGANIGILTLAAAGVVGSRGRVYAVEPHPRTFAYLRENVALNDLSQVECFQCALGASTGTVLFSEGLSDDERAVLAGGDGVRVPSRTLDDILEPVEAISLLKIDVEGYEQFVLQGAARTLIRTQCIYFEGSDALARRFDSSVSAVIRLLNDAGFLVYHKPQDRRVRMVRPGDPLPPHTDYIAVRDEQFLRDRLGVESSS